MRSLRKIISMGLHKLLGVPYYGEVSEYELRNIAEREPYILIQITRLGIYNIATGGKDSEEKAASESLKNYLEPEILFLHHNIDRRLKELNESIAIIPD